MSQKTFISQETYHINLNGERHICTVSAYIKEFLSIVDIENEICQICSKLKTQVELVSDKFIMSPEGLPSSNSPRQIDHKKFTKLENDTVVLDVILQNYFQKILFEDVIFENCSSGGSGSI